MQSSLALAECRHLLTPQSETINLTIPRAIRYETTPLLPEYVDEIRRGGINGDLRYLGPEDRLGFIIDVRDGKLIDTSGRLLHGSYNFVMDATGIIYANLNANISLHHSCFLAGGPVAAAGSFEIYRGRLRRMDNQSGHYKPSWKLLKQSINELTERGLDFTKVRVSIVNQTPNFFN